jgi:hypothetical protein
MLTWWIQVVECLYQHFFTSQTAIYKKGLSNSRLLHCSSDAHLNVIRADSHLNVMTADAHLNFMRGGCVSCPRKLVLWVSTQWASMSTNRVDSACFPSPVIAPSSTGFQTYGMLSSVPFTDAALLRLMAKARRNAALKQQPYSTLVPPSFLRFHPSTRISRQPRHAPQICFVSAVVLPLSYKTPMPF